MRRTLEELSEYSLDDPDDIEEYLNEELPGDIRLEQGAPPLNDAEYKTTIEYNSDTYFFGVEHNSNTGKDELRLTADESNGSAKHTDLYFSKNQHETALDWIGGELESLDSKDDSFW